MEIIDLYTSEHEKAGGTIVRGNDIPEGVCGMVVFVCVFNANGNMLIQQRDERKSWGGMWDVSAGGVVRSEETSVQAAARELAEEVGIEKQPDELVKVLSVYYEGYLHEIFTTQADVDAEKLVLQEEEVQAVKWASREVIREMIADGEFLAVYEEFIDLLFRMKTRQGVMKD